ncbi:MAG: hypothetical protein R2744_09140 [Bacteroidales bacterium]
MGYEVYRYNRVPTAYIEGSYRGHKASPGVYTVTIASAGKEAKTTCTILPNPTYPLTDADYREYNRFMLAMESTLTSMHKKVNTILDMRTQLEDVLKNMNPKDTTLLMAKGKSLVKKMKEWDELMVQRKSKAYDDVENFPNKFTAEYMFLLNQAESSIPRINDPTRERLKELTAEWSILDTTAIEIMETDIPAYNKLLWETGIGAVRTRK